MGPGFLAGCPPWIPCRFRFLIRLGVRFWALGGSPWEPLGGGVPGPWTVRLRPGRGARRADALPMACQVTDDRIREITRNGLDKVSLRGPLFAACPAGRLFCCGGPQFVWPPPQARMSVTPSHPPRKVWEQGCGTWYGVHFSPRQAAGWELLLWWVSKNKSQCWTVGRHQGGALEFLRSRN